MAVTHNSDNSAIWACKTFPELVRMAALEQAGDQLIWFRAIGESAVLTADVAQDVWHYGGTRAFPYTNGETYSVVSASANDAFGGTGAQYVNIIGLDTSYNLQNETVVMNGTTPVVTTNSYITVIRARVVTSGSTKSNVGNITITGSTSSSVYGHIEAVEGISKMSHFTVPAGYTLYTIDVAISAYRLSGAASTRVVAVDQFVYIPSINTLYNSIGVSASNVAAYISSPNLPSSTPEKTTLWYKATSDTSNTKITTSVGYLLIKGDYNLITEI